jgi:peptide/nickel transport system substrate-binding protein
MMFRPKLLVVVAALVLATTAADPAVAQKQGGVLKVYFFDSPASMSIHEESTIAGQGPAMGVFNNLVMYD